mmetsp:Transcript_91474/g.258302  ORF Transcript_91474/g.258302 Transcript_91474/m.258302 type:complete len:339 (-) Transcript_91474:266-1282(-)
MRGNHCRCTADLGCGRLQRVPALSRAPPLRLQQGVTLRSEGLLEEVAGVVVVKDGDRLGHCGQLLGPELRALRPLLGLLLQGLPDLLNETAVVGHLGGQSVNLGLRLLLRQAAGSMLDLELRQRLLRRRLLLALRRHELLVLGRGVKLLAESVLEARRERRIQSEQNLLDLQRAGLVRHLECRLPVQLFPIPRRHVAGEEAPEEARVAGGEDTVAEIGRAGEGAALFRMRREARLDAQEAASPRALCEQNALQMVGGGILEDCHGRTQRLDALHHLILCVDELLVLLGPNRGRLFHCLVDFREVLLEIHTLGGKLMAAGLDVGYVRRELVDAARGRGV